MLNHLKVEDKVVPPQLGLQMYKSIRLKRSVPASLRLSSLSLLSGLVPYSNTCFSVWTDCSSSKVALRPRMLCKNRENFLNTASFKRWRCLKGLHRGNKYMQTEHDAAIET